MCVQPASWPEPDPQIAAAIAAKYPGKRLPLRHADDLLAPAGLPVRAG